MRTALHLGGVAAMGVGCMVGLYAMAVGSRRPVRAAYLLVLSSAACGFSFALLSA
ncbi:hypothetical protein CPT_Sansa119 [Caulobacter phage Sansa]|uniref:Uncharacterized protein n=1 Tax=Caulobacter phage Sansa TaxID=1675600 RepID=A0A0K1LMI5_9CAUD|nr:hypothetical protein HOR07_gp004 [Caulobacter phage Sansa]YP_009785507.1 hypothetical protein HOR07_gp119 [Caulobacter phage Sansa]AKU43408.1 hypothetical protein CPT_Sansa4 [Caulobacter phage Sansa]AKU43523.1 hypothetical protein CPT_Sansa119 [Caulobacter phage Sansa]